MNKQIVVFCLLLLLMGCTKQTYAPVINAWEQPQSKQGIHIVRKGETLYSIAWRYGYDYRDIASLNHISYPYTIHVGQALNLKVSKPHSIAKPVKKDSKTSAKNSSSELKKSKDKLTMKQPIVASTNQKGGAIKWNWPYKGKIKQYFSTKESELNKGINIAGVYGSPIKASASGEVVYSGNGLLGYGNLIIIKHNDDYLSAYAFNRINLVREGMQVKAGQKIAEMGYDKKGQPVLHFEIRKDGKPVDPLKYLS